MWEPLSPYVVVALTRRQVLEPPERNALEGVGRGSFDWVLFTAVVVFPLKRLMTA